MCLVGAPRSWSPEYHLHVYTYLDDIDDAIRRCISAFRCSNEHQHVYACIYDVEGIDCTCGVDSYVDDVEDMIHDVRDLDDVGGVYMM